jgi:hypothetical protein
MRLIDAIDGFMRRSWLAWRYVRALGYAPMVAWAKARRTS